MVTFKRNRISIGKYLRTKKHNVFVYAMNEVTLSNGHWDGGSRSQYYGIDIVTGNAFHLDYPTTPEMFGGSEPSTIALEQGKAIIRTGTFQGKEATSAIYVLPCDLPKLFGFDDYFAIDTPATIVYDWLSEKGIEF